MGKKKWKQKYVFNLQPENLQACSHPLQWWCESSYETRKHWKQSGKGTEPIPWSPIIRCARPWRETRAQSAINKGAWEGRVVTVTKMFSDRHLVSYETCLYHRSKSKSILSTPGWNALGQRVTELKFRHWHMLPCVFISSMYQLEKWGAKEHHLKANQSLTIVHLPFKPRDGTVLNTASTGLVSLRWCNYNCKNPKEYLKYGLGLIFFPSSENEKFHN